MVSMTIAAASVSGPFLTLGFPLGLRKPVGFVGPNKHPSRTEICPDNSEKGDNDAE